MRLPNGTIPPHIQALADQFMTDAQSRFGHGVWSMNEAGEGENGDGGDGGAGAASDGNGQPANATDSNGRDLGFPTGTSVEDMTEGQQAAYWRNESKKHQGRFNNLTGGRSFDETKADLEAFAEHKRSQQTPADQALAERYEQGKKDAILTASTQAATAILTANLRARFEASGLEGSKLDDEVQDTLDVINVGKFIGDDGDIDTDRLAAAANRFGSTPASGGSVTPQRRDFGGGTRGGTSSRPGGGSVAQVMKDRADARAAKN